MDKDGEGETGMDRGWGEGEELLGKKEEEKEEDVRGKIEKERMRRRDELLGREGEEEEEEVRLRRG